jgi:hypothetical protein
MNVTARMTVSRITIHSKISRTVELDPVYSDDKSSPNYSFSKYTPSGKIEMQITNPNAWPLFEIGASIDVLFTPTPVADAD